MRTAVLAVLVVLAGCGGSDDDGGSGDADADPGAPDACAPPEGDPGTLYLNREGGTYTAGPDDSAANTTGLLVEDEEHTVPPHPFGDENWDAIVACFTAGLAPFHIDIVEEDPGDVDHTELVFTEESWFEVGIQSISSFSCAGYPRGIAFVFADEAREDAPEAQCLIALNQLGGLAAGLEHAFQCEDFMSQQPCNEKSWVNDDLTCGDVTEVSCQCGGTTQNSYQKMAATFGPRCL